MHLHKEPAAPSQPKLLVTIPEAAKMLSIGRTKFYELIKAGEIKPKYIGSAARISVAELQEWIARQGEKKCEKGESDLALSAKVM